MDYKLSLKLKNAGYPQKGEFFFGKNVNEEWEARHQDHWAEFSFTGFEEGPICPTLSELIEACGTSTKDIYRMTNGEDNEVHRSFVLWFDDMVENPMWHAGYYQYGSDNYIDDYPIPNESGSTPEEAVANLWLKLNK